MADEQPTKRNWRFEDLTGQKFGHWTVLQFSHTNASKRTLWLCQCDCGSDPQPVISNNLKRGISTSCGCDKGRLIREAKTKHGHGGAVNSDGQQTRKPTSEYIAWQHAKDRCDNPNNVSYSDWGARGIYMCDEWRNSFEAFIRDMGPKPGPEFSLNRIDNDGPYTKENCEWTTIKKQNNNRRPRRWWKRPTER